MNLKVPNSAVEATTGIEIDFNCIVNGLRVIYKIIWIWRNQLRKLV